MDLITQAFTTDALKATMSRRRLRTSPGPLGDPSKTNDPGLQAVRFTDRFATTTTRSIKRTLALSIRSFHNRYLAKPNSMRL
ncbi:hypothetical protein PC119_g10253 [Phytophthora cactorum]|nr:hypothetical protein PC111_g8868 [Phytophthora cactorum]KAG3019553.1 hypothetical protein PC119_g10253 [Phytophthora cactorum]